MLQLGKNIINAHVAQLKAGILYDTDDVLDIYPEEGGYVENGLSDEIYEGLGLEKNHVLALDFSSSDKGFLLLDAHVDVFIGSPGYR